MAGITAAEAFDKLENIGKTKEAFIALLEEISLSYTPEDESPLLRLKYKSLN